MKTKLLVLTLAMLCASGAQSGRAMQGTPAPDSCYGVDIYVEAYREALKTYWAFSEEHELLYRDPMTLSHTEWLGLAERAEAAQTALHAIVPPPEVAGWHQAQIDWMGLEGAFAREVLENGVTAAELAFEEAREELVSLLSEEYARADEKCPGFSQSLAYQVTPPES